MSYIKEYEVYYELLDVYDENIPSVGKIMVQARDVSIAKEYGMNRIAAIWGIRYKDIVIKDVLYWDEIYVEDYNFE